MLGNESVFARNYFRWSKYNSCSWSWQYSVVVGARIGDEERRTCERKVRTSIWSPRRQLPIRESYVRLLYSHKMPCSAHRLLVIRRTSRGGRDTTPARRTAQHSTIYRVSRDTVQSTSRIPLSGRR